MTGRTRHELAGLEWRMERDTAETVACPRCGAVPRVDGVERPEQHCHNTITGDELRAPAHDARVRAARSE